MFNNQLFILLKDTTFWILFDAMKMVKSQNTIIKNYPETYELKALTRDMSNRISFLLCLLGTTYSNFFVFEMFPVLSFSIYMVLSKNTFPHLHGIRDMTVTTGEWGCTLSNDPLKMALWETSRRLKKNVT